MGTAAPSAGCGRSWAMARRASWRTSMARPGGWSWNDRPRPGGSLGAAPDAPAAAGMPYGRAWLLLGQGPGRRDQPGREQEGAEMHRLRRPDRPGAAGQARAISAWGL